jgi:3-keto-L-gulonate-6-phosphate decarboxylase
MKLQISFDMTDLEQAIKIATDVADYCDQVEVGTLLIYQSGMDAVKKFREALPDKKIVADTKIIDRAEEITMLAAQSGANWITVMGGTNKSVLYAVARASKQYNVNVMIDLIDADAPGQTAMEAHAFGGDAILMHKPHDEDESLNFLDQWDLVRNNTKLPIFISAKINRSNVNKIIKLNPEGIVIGHAITDAENPRTEAKHFYELCKANKD